MDVLIVTNKTDFPCDEVVRKIESKGGSVFRFNTEDFCTEIGATLRIEQCGLSGEIHSSLRKLNLRDLKSVFFRRPLRSSALELDPASREVVEGERNAFQLWLWEGLPCFWVSRPSAIRRAESKIDQLRIAPSLGFAIPKTLITTDPAAALEFYRECGGQVVNKVLAKGVVKSNGKSLGLYTHRLTEDDLKRPDSISLLPCVFQEYVEKKVEVRVTVVGQKVFAAEIHSQASERTRDDWRKYDFPNTPYLPHALPSEVGERCVELVRHYGLAYGAIDLVLTPQGEYVFLEINPNGQWLWVEKLTGLPIADEIASMLLRGRL